MNNVNETRNLFEISLEEEKELEEKYKRGKEEFESLNLDYYRDYDYGVYSEFVSSLEHYVKSYGYGKFVNEYITEDRLSVWKEHERLFAVGYAEYLCNKYSIQVPDSIYEYREVKLAKLLFHPGVLNMMEDGLYSVALRCYNNRILELFNHGIVIDNIEDVV